MKTVILPVAGSLRGEDVVNALEFTPGTSAFSGAYADLTGKPTLGTAAALASDADTALAANSDTRLPTQKAVKAYVDAHAGGGSAVFAVEQDTIYTITDWNAGDQVQLRGDPTTNGAPEIRFVDAGPAFFTVYNGYPHAGVTLTNNQTGGKVIVDAAGTTLTAIPADATMNFVYSDAIGLDGAWVSGYVGYSAIPTVGLSAALAAQGIGALSLYGDGSDGTVTVDGDAINFPALAGIDDWAAATPYAVGDLVKSTGSHVRIFECIAAGVSGSEDPCPDTAPGNAMCGNRFFDAGINPTPVWEQVTKIIANTVEGPIFATTMTVASTRTLVDHGWPLYARTEFILDGSLSSAGFAATAAVPVDLTIFLGVQTLLGRGVAGVAPILGDTAGGNAGATWGGGMGGYGGSGDDGAAAAMGNKFGTDAPGFSLARRMISTLFAAYYYGLDPEAALGTIGSSGGAGRCAAIAPDFDTGPLGGASGSAGSGVAILANRLTLNGSISSVGGDGGDAEQSGNTGGGGGGSGGCCVLVYGIKTGAGTVDVSGGVGGIGHGTGTAGTDGSPGDFVEFANA